MNEIKDCKYDVCDRCVICGSPVPEGAMVCLNCQEETKNCNQKNCNQKKSDQKKVKIKAKNK